MDPNKTRRQLENLRAQLAARLTRLDRHLHHRDEPLPADANERAIELEGREILEGLDDGATVELSHIDHALARLDAGTYGRCDACGKPIAPARLEALPWATRCIGCAAAAERPGGR
ncbi:MAG: TraR/DksA family transcriptional regulator [Planctomycetes bacterium]|nr:TraR/DksA family transcriptional regulator [Planctomycetota bacterium]